MDKIVVCALFGAILLLILCTCCYLAGYKKGTQDIAKFHNSVWKTPNEWVRVKDAMPPEHEPVLCIVSGSPKPNIILDETYQLGSWNNDDGWIIDEYLEWTDADVLWWRMLPAPPDCRPPEGEDNGE